MSKDVTVVSKSQVIHVDQASGHVSVLNAGPIGPAGPSGGTNFWDFDGSTLQPNYAVLLPLLEALQVVVENGIGLESNNSALAQNGISAICANFISTILQSATTTSAYAQMVVTKSSSPTKSAYIEAHADPPDLRMQVADGAQNSIMALESDALEFSGEVVSTESGTPGSVIGYIVVRGPWTGDGYIPVYDGFTP